VIYTKYTDVLDIFEDFKTQIGELKKERDANAVAIDLFMRQESTISTLREALKEIFARDDITHKAELRHIARTAYNETEED
jgi:hypothetical protein